MSRNVNSFFSENPASLDISRSKFIRNQSIKTSFNAGELIPFYLDEVLPGDTMSIDTSKVVRLSTLITPIMDDIYLDTYYFFVPNRIVWEDWKAFMGEAVNAAWLPNSTYAVPFCMSPTITGWEKGTIADYMGIPTDIPDLRVNSIPFYGYAMICNDWFRDENLTTPIFIDHSCSNLTGSNGNNYLTDIIAGGKPFKVAKYADYFTKCLPAPQRGPDVLLPLGGDSIVYAGSNNNFSSLPEVNGILFASSQNTLFNSRNLGTSSSSESSVSSTSEQFTPSSKAIPVNLVADLSSATGTTINQLRTAFQVQKMYEKDARGGVRYIEMLKSHFGVTSPDARQQRPEYLGGSRIPINVTQVIQNSESNNTPQGHASAYSLSIDSHSDFTKSFSEHGFVFGLLCVRYSHTYQQGLERFWSRTYREDYYFPVLANIGEQAVKNKEIYAVGGNNSTDDQVFGYQEAWADYRYKPNRVSGMMRSNYTNSLDCWHLADDYASLPYLSDAWIREDYSNIDRVVAVTSQVSDQFIADIYVKNVSVRPMPLYSVPGFIDHH